MPLELFFEYRGQIRAIAARQETLIFTTVHTEGRATAVYWLKPIDETVEQQPLPCGGVALAYDPSAVYVAGTDQRIYQLPKDQAPKPLTEPFAQPIRQLLVISGDRLAVLLEDRVEIISRRDGAIQQTLELPASGTCLSSDNTGQWLAVGTESGVVSVFECQGKLQWDLSDSSKLHDGAVSAILFEPEELRFFSAGFDHKLYSTYAKGRLEAEDKGRTNNHTDVITSMAFSQNGERLITVSRDGVVKNWPRVGAIKPMTLYTVLPKASALAVFKEEEYGVVYLAVADSDQTIHTVGLNPEGRFYEDADQDEWTRIQGGLAWAKNLLGDAHDAKSRLKAMSTLAKWNDADSIPVLAERIHSEPDLNLRVSAVRLLAGLSNARVVPILLEAIQHKDGKVRQEVFYGLQKQLGAKDLQPIQVAFQTGHAEIGLLAVKALTPLAKADDQALAILLNALDAQTWDVRRQTTLALEELYAATSIEPTLLAIAAKSADVQTLAMTRAYQRKLWNDPTILGSIRRRLEDADDTVRRVAYLLLVLSRPELAHVLRSRDEQLHRQCVELDGTETPQPAVSSKSLQSLQEADYHFLLQATSSRALDTCLRGVRALSLLGDSRAFGLLLQLSREESANARVEVCRALAALNDPRAENRLKSLLFDPEVSVRDAAYTALARLYIERPLDAATAGLSADAEDVRRRAFETLTAYTRLNLPKNDQDPSWQLFIQTLNDSAMSIRKEAFKAALNQNLAGTSEATLRMIAQSIHADVRREALTELQAQHQQSWAGKFLPEFFHDPDAGLRQETLDFLTKKTKELQPLEQALQSRYADTRLQAIELLAKKHTRESWGILQTALEDSEPRVRIRAMESLIADDVQDQVRAALQSLHADVRIAAATALAKIGDDGVLPTFKEFAFAPEPNEPEKKSYWLSTTQAAIQGLGVLGNSEVFPELCGLLDSSHTPIRHQAAKALQNVAQPEHLPKLRGYLSHADSEVRYSIAFALATLGDATMMPLIWSEEGQKQLGHAALFSTALALGPVARTKLSQFLDHPEEFWRIRAFQVHLLLELAGKDSSPDFCLQALSAKAPRIRLLAAEALAAFANPDDFFQVTLKVLNDRGDENPWKISRDTVKTLSAILTHGSTQLRAKLIEPMMFFRQKDQAGWDAAWKLYQTLKANDIALAMQQWAPKPSSLSETELREFTFGAYVGLVREQGASSANSAIIRVRQTAIERILQIAEIDRSYLLPVRSVLTQSLLDNNQEVRLQAFSTLLTLGMDKTQLGEEALQAGHTDLGVKGLELLTDGTSSKEGVAVLQRVMQTRTDAIALESMKLLLKSQKPREIAEAALDAVSDAVRLQAIDTLLLEYDQDGEAQNILRLAVKSRYRSVRESAAFALATRKDPAAFEVLTDLLQEAIEEKRQRKIVEAFQQLGDRRAGSVLFARILNDPSGTAQAAYLLSCAGTFYQPESVPLAFQCAEKFPELRQSVFRQIFTISGFAQEYDEQNEILAAKLEQKQHPRHPKILAQLLEKLLSLGLIEKYSLPVEKARVSRDGVVDPILVTLLSHPNKDLRYSCIDTLGWRLKHRGVAPALLKPCLKHKDPRTQFLAAEALAKVGQADGFQILLTSIEYQPDLEDRRRAVLAIGQLGEQRSFDILLKLANDNGHALQEPAMEAIGHLRKSAKADIIYAILDKHARSNQLSLKIGALQGLRWFDSAEGWQRIRRATEDANWRIRSVACELLRYNDTDVSRTTLLKNLERETDAEVLEHSFLSAVALYGVDHFEPAYALLKNSEFDDEFSDATVIDYDPIQAVLQRGDALRILKIFAECPVQRQRQLEQALTQRAELPVKEAREALSHAHPATVRLAARLLGVAKDTASATRTAITSALAVAWQRWQDLSDRQRNSADDAEKLQEQSQTLITLCWAASQIGAGSAELMTIVQQRPDDVAAKVVRLQAMESLATMPKSPEFLRLCQLMVTERDASLRTLAVQILAQIEPSEISKSINSLLSDRLSFLRAYDAGAISAEQLKHSLEQAHTLPVVLSALITAQDMSNLKSVAENRASSEPVRLGAIEGLAMLASKEAEAVLETIGQDDKNDDDLRKAAWKGLRRSRRARNRIPTSAA